MKAKAAETRAASGAAKKFGAPKKKKYILLTRTQTGVGLIVRRFQCDRTPPVTVGPEIIILRADEEKKNYSLDANWGDERFPMEELIAPRSIDLFIPSAREREPAKKLRKKREMEINCL